MLLDDIQPGGVYAANGELAIWTVYYNPQDFPGLYVARRFMVGKGNTLATEDVVTAKDVRPIRTAFRERGYYRLNRQEGDDPSILESWI